MIQHLARSFSISFSRFSKFVISVAMAPAPSPGTIVIPGRAGWASFSPNSLCLFSQRILAAFNPSQLIPFKSSLFMKGLYPEPCVEAR